MNNKILTLITAVLVLVTGGSAVADDDRVLRDGDKNSVTRRIRVLEDLVERQARQIVALQKALKHEVNARATNDILLQLQITNAQQSAFSPAQVETLQGVAAVASVVQSNIYLAGNICVGGNFAVRHGSSLFVSHIQPSDGAWGGDATGIMVIDGNVGIQATNTLFVNTLMPFKDLPALPGEWQGIGFHGNALWDGGILFRKF